jgi:hypothetical protein
MYEDQVQTMVGKVVAITRLSAGYPAGKLFPYAYKPKQPHLLKKSLEA